MQYATQAKYGAPKLKMYAAYHFIVKITVICAHESSLWEGTINQDLSWLKTYSNDQALVGRWIMALEKYHFRVEHGPRT